MDELLLLESANEGFDIDEMLPIEIDVDDCCVKEGDEENKGDETEEAKKACVIPDSLTDCLSVNKIFSTSSICF